MIRPKVGDDVNMTMKHSAGRHGWLPRRQPSSGVPGSRFLY